MNNYKWTPSDRQLLSSQRNGIPVEKKIDIGNGIQMQFILVPFGHFYMGSLPSEYGRDEDEGPIHNVKIQNSFYLSKFPITQPEYEVVTGFNPSFYKGDELPVEQVSWHESVQYCKTLSQRVGFTIRLPTEAEWEYACRAGTDTEYNLGNGLDALRKSGWCSYDNVWGSAKKTIAVGSFSPNHFGMYDMHGNVWEWCQDWYGSNYYSKNCQLDPKGPLNGTYRVLRGGSWGDTPPKCRSAWRIGSPPSARDYNKGFRVVMSIP